MKAVVHSKAPSVLFHWAKRTQANAMYKIRLYRLETTSLKFQQKLQQKLATVCTTAAEALVLGRKGTVRTKEQAQV
jgi:hypothetical protein